MPTFNNKPNFRIKAEDGETYWISRAVAVVPVPFFCLKGRRYLPLARRSEKMELEPGKLGLPSGFLDWGENLTECVQREIWEELGIFISEDAVELGSIRTPFSVYSTPNPDENETVAMRLTFEVSVLEELPPLKSNDGETSEFLWLDCTKVMNEGADFPEMAFNQATVVELAWDQLEEDLARASDYDFAH